MLHYAARTGRQRTVELLIKFNADPFVYNLKGKKPLDIVCTALGIAPNYAAKKQAIKQLLQAHEEEWLRNNPIKKEEAPDSQAASENPESSSEGSSSSNEKVPAKIEQSPDELELSQLLNRLNLQNHEPKLRDSGIKTVEDLRKAQLKTLRKAGLNTSSRLTVVSEVRKIPTKRR